MALTGPYYWNGTTAPTQGGAPVLITLAEFLDCCCGGIEYSETDCEDACDAGKTPLHFTVTFSDMQACAGGGDCRADHIAYMNSNAIVLTQSGVYPCAWNTTIDIGSGNCDAGDLLLVQLAVNGFGTWSLGAGYISFLHGPGEDSEFFVDYDASMTCSGGTATNGFGSGDCSLPVIAGWGGTATIVAGP